MLRGPKGTLFGKNTTAGAIHIISREPTFTPESNSEVSFGPFNFFQAKGISPGRCWTTRWQRGYPGSSRVATASSTTSSPAMN
ncbi:hypothetical protein [Nevskia sp.]|uniref:hypothetical protein n=1 Tax=Nevskia sp. TaxID=1929292 RepID=UPI003F6F67B1